MKTDNPIHLNGMGFIEFAACEKGELEKVFDNLGFQKVGVHKTKDILLYRQNKVFFIINNEKTSFAFDFAKEHGPSVCATAFRTKNAEESLSTAVQRGGKVMESVHSFPAMYGIGDSAIYFVDKEPDTLFPRDFDYDSSPQKGCGLVYVDHLTNNVPSKAMAEWCNFYESIFNFRETRFFDIKGLKTGLVSKVMSSPCDKIIIPINEPTDPKSQIQEYIEEYKGAGVQHIALGTADIVKAIRFLRGKGVEFLDVPDTYYEELPNRVPNITEDIDELRELKILVDGDDKGYLLQIFTKNQIGPIFFEIIQRKNNDGFGEGNFQALFDAIERDQQQRGYLD